MVLKVNAGRILLEGRHIESSINQNSEGYTGILLKGGYGYYSLARLTCGDTYAWDLGIDGSSGDDGADNDTNNKYRFIISLNNNSDESSP